NMSADNQAEPVAAVAAAVASSGSGSGASSEYLKRTCLICGCQTNQTINIYEPRSGPNIVQLIQAKFKFQPLNEDKFLCFSCNNWLINWHSLQAVNSNDAEAQNQSQSQSAAHMGNSCSRDADSAQQQQQRPKVRPVAQVRPQPQPQAPVPAAPRLSSPATPTAVQPAPVVSYNKRRFGRRTAAAAAAAAGARGLRKMLRHCRSCGAAIVLRLLTSQSTQTLSKLARRSARTQCRRCRESELCKWRQLHRRSLAKVLQLQRTLRQRQEQTLVKMLATASAKQPHTQAQTQAHTQTHQRLPAARVDGKVVAMFRRLGTTLSLEREEEQQQQQQQQEPLPTARPLRIMSPAKQRPRWTRCLDDDEILLEFDSAISEVLPAAAPAATSTTARRRLRYQLTEAQAQAAKSSPEVDVSHQTESRVSLAALQLPRGLSITLV
ncbi:hypothetical protein KR222_005431, partial [Zaprionus bogoriensis]